jgi:hypothetical protein
MEMAEHDAGGLDPTVTSKDPIASFSHDVKTTFGELAEPVKDKAMEVAQSQKDIGADQLSIVAKAIHGAACELQSEMPEIAQYVHTAGKKVEKAASDLRGGSIEDLMGKFSSFARSQPVTVFGSAIIAGFAVTRFAKATTKTIAR